MMGFGLLDEPDFSVVLSILADPDSLGELRDKVSCLPASSRFSDAQIEIIYGVGFSAYVQGKIDAACNVFHMLLLYRPLDERLIFSLGICTKRLGQYDLAIKCFSTLIVLDPLNLANALHLAECLVAFGLPDEAEKLISPLIEVARIDSSMTALHKRALAIQNIIASNFFSELQS